MFITFTILIYILFFQIIQLFCCQHQCLSVIWFFCLGKGHLCVILFQQIVRASHIICGLCVCVCGDSSTLTITSINIYIRDLGTCRTFFSYSTWFWLTLPPVFACVYVSLYSIIFCVLVVWCKISSLGCYKYHNSLPRISRFCLLTCFWSNYGKLND